MDDSHHVTLTGSVVSLIPLEEDHVTPLLELAMDDRSTYQWTPVPWDRESMERYVASALAKGAEGVHVPFLTIERRSGRPVGTTRFYDIETWDWTSHRPEGGDLRPAGAHDRTCIGYTWLHPSAQRTAINTEAKLLMMNHAFDVFQVRCVRFHTDARNLRSRAAIERLGCTLDGILRADRPATDGTARSTAVLSMLAEEWPPHRSRLAQRVADGLDRSSDS